MKAKTILIIISSLIMGGAIGFFVAGSLAHKKMDRMRTRAEHPEHMVDHLLKKMDLPTDQHMAMERVLRNHFERVKDDRREFRKKIKEERDELMKDVDAILNDEQMKKWKSLHKRKRGRGEKRKLEEKWNGEE